MDLTPIMHAIKSSSTAGLPVVNIRVEHILDAQNGKVWSVQVEKEGTKLAFIAKDKVHALSCVNALRFAISRNLVAHVIVTHKED